MTEKERLARRRKGDRMITFSDGVHPSPIASTNQDLECQDEPAPDVIVSQIEPGAIRVGIEREGAIRILSDALSEEEQMDANRSRSELLVQAHIVDENYAASNNNGQEEKVLATATPDPWWRRHQWWLAGGVVVVLGAIVVAVVMTTVEFGTPETDSPSMSLTTYLGGVEARTVDLIEPSLPPDAVSRLAEVSSPQSRALEWVTEQGFVDEAAYSDSLILQYYSLAVLYYGTGGESSWIRRDSWLNATSLCDWYGVDCSVGDDGTGTLAGLNLTSNGLSKSLSSDILLLEAQLRLLDLSNNDGPSQRILAD